ncbi:hypothetical protein F5Y15DRAFT_351586 [Xylariaceae sp. FL0016]|nr:hypothetical protein F5Y15DRAFT_351586 [Xylariaceae sp. FL0016]
MAPLDIDSQFRFLISCIRHSSSGKVDFDQVHKECDIVSKGAAAKRYERLMKQHGIPTGGGVAVKKETKAAKDIGKASKASKKRKLEAVDEDAGDDDEIKDTKPPKSARKNLPVKSESDGNDDGGDADSI